MATLTDTTVPHAERVKAAQALATSKDPLAVDTLIKALGSTDEKLTSAVRGSLKALKAAPTLEQRLLDERTPAAGKVQAAIGLRTLKEPTSVKPLADALKDASPLVRREAALALAVLGPAPAEEALLAVLGDPDGDVRYFVAEALGDVRTPRVKQLLEARLAVEANPTVRFALKGAKDKHERP